jgi:hypothetical protein
MLIRAGYDISFAAAVPTPMMAMLSVHPSRHKDLRTPHRITTVPPVPIQDYVDAFGNVCTRVTVPAGGLTLSCDFTIEDSGLLDPQTPGAIQHPIEDLPDEVLIFLLGSRYCETDRLSETAWSLFGHVPPGGSGCARSSTSPIITLSSAITMPARPRLRGTPIRRSRACAATSRTWPSPCVAA